MTDRETFNELRRQTWEKIKEISRPLKESEHITDKSIEETNQLLRNTGWEWKKVPNKVERWRITKVDNFDD